MSSPESSGPDAESRIAGVRAGRIISRCSLRWCPGARSCPGVFPVTEVDASVTVPPELKMPPPWAAVLPLTWL